MSSKPRSESWKFGNTTLAKVPKPLPSDLAHQSTKILPKKIGAPKMTVAHYAKAKLGMK